MIRLCLLSNCFLNRGMTVPEKCAMWEKRRVLLSAIIYTDERQEVRGQLNTRFDRERLKC